MAKKEISQIRNETIKKIRDYHIIRGILNSLESKSKSDPKVSGLVSAYEAYVKFFGGIQISSLENFNQAFSRLESDYIGGDDSKRVNPEADGYIHYLNEVLGESFIDKFSEILREPKNVEKMSDFYLEVGRKQESTALVVAKAVRDYAMLSKAMDDYYQAVALGQKKDEKIAELQALLGVAKDKELTVDQILTKVGDAELRIIAKIIANTPKSNDDLIKGIAVLTGRKVNEIKTSMDKKHSEVLSSIGEIKTPLAGISADLGTVKVDVSHIKSKVDVMATDIDEIKKNTAGLGKKKTALAVTAGAAGMAALLVGGHFLGSAIYNAVTPDKMTEAELLTDYMNLVSVINGLQTDGISDAEKQNFVDVDLSAFVEKYKGTNLEAKSLECRDALLANINGVMGIGNQVTMIAGYFQDTAALDSTLSALIQSNGGLDLTEKDGFISGDVAAFTAKYAGTSLESASKSDAAGFIAYANAAYDLGQSSYDDLKALADAYSTDVKSLIVELDRLTNDTDGLTQVDKDAFIGSAADPNATSVYNFTTKYAGTAFETASNGQGTEFSALAETLRILTQSGVDLSAVNADLVGYGNDVAKLNVDLSNLINDADGLTQTEKDNFFANDVATFTAKYAGTALESASKNQETGLESIANTVLGFANLTTENALLSGYHLDIQNLNATLGALISNDGILDAAEKDAFIGSATDPNAVSVYNFLEDYKGTSLESASIAQANGFTTIANSTYAMAEAQQLAGEYNKDLTDLDKALYGYLADSTYEAAEKTDFEAKVQAFVDKYASTTFASRSTVDADVMKTLSDNIYGMSELKQQAIGELAAEKGKVAGLESRISTLEATNQTYADKITALEEQVKELSDKIDELLKQVGSAPTDAQVQALLAQIDELNKQVKTLEGQVTALEGQVSTLTTENAELKEKNAELTQEVADLKAENAELKADIDEANATIDSLNQVVDILKTEKASLEEQLKNKDITIAEYQERIAELEAVEAELRAQIKDLTKQIADIAEELEEKKAAYNALVSELQAAKDKIAELEAEKAALAEDLKNNYISKAEYDAKVAELQAEIDANKALIAENAELQKQLAEARAQIVALEEQLAGSSAEATALVFDIYEYITGTTTNDVATAMKVISEQLGITTVPPSQDAESNAKQPS